MCPPTLTTISAAPPPLLPASFVLLDVVLDDGATAAQRPAPERVQLVLHAGDTGGVQPVDPAGPHGLNGDQPSVLQHPQMLRHRLPADRKPGGEFPDRTGPLGQV